MFNVVKEKNGAPIKMWTRGVQVEDVALQQLKNVASMPFIHKHVAVMPDVHWGMGATIGSVIPTRDVIIPAAVGVDLGCGMVAARTTLTASDLPDSLTAMRSRIEEVVPHGRSHNGGPGDIGAWSEIPDHVGTMWKSLSTTGVWDEMCHKHPKIAKSNNVNHLGTLGGGNHFIEICLDKEDRVWAMLHSGSRGVGNRIGNYFIRLAKQEMKRWHINLPDVDLSYFPEGSRYFGDYVKAVTWAQRFARENREIMMKQVLMALFGQVKKPGAVVEETVVNCHHNYVSRERHFGANVWVTRKGAVSAKDGEMGIIPGSMGVKSFIVRGKGNRESFHSCSHGAGRAMSRTEAKRRFTVEDHVKSTEGVECHRGAAVIDETPEP